MATAIVRARAIVASADHARYAQMLMLARDYIAANPQIHGSITFGFPFTLPNGDQAWSIVLTADAIPANVTNKIDTFNETWDPGGVP